MTSVEAVVSSKIPTSMWDIESETNLKNDVHNIIILEIWSNNMSEGSADEVWIQNDFLWCPIIN
jgi:hypothetical protein